MRGDEQSRGQVGIGTLIVFIAMVLVAAMAAGALINTADLLEQTASDTADESQQQVTDRVMIVSAMGNVTTNGSHVHNISMLVQAGPGSGTINLTKATVYADYGNTSTWLTVTDKDNNDCDALSDGDTCYLYIDSTFPPGEEISLKIVTAQGATTTFTTQIPDSLANEGAVALH